MATLSTAASALMTQSESESSPSLQDMWAIPFLAALFPLVRLLLDSLVFEPAGRHLIFKRVRELAKSGKTDAASEALSAGNISVESIDREALERTHTKFKESCWKALFYGSSTLFALHVCLGEPWMSNPQFFFLGPNDLVWPNLPMKLKLKAYLLFAGGFYAYSVFALVYWETRRKDFGVSMVHHFCALGLIAVCYVFRQGRIGTAVLLVHDACDIFLEMAKISRYLNNQTLASVFFATFAGSWAALRLWCFPRYIIYAASYLTTRSIWFYYPGHPSTLQCLWESVAPLVRSAPELQGYFESRTGGVPVAYHNASSVDAGFTSRTSSPVETLLQYMTALEWDRSGALELGPPLFYFFSTLLQLLLFLHVYWWILIVRVLMRSINQAGKVEDVRSDDSDSD